MYNPTAYWGQQDLTASVLANYRGAGGIGNTVSYSFNGNTQSAVITAPTSSNNYGISGYNTFCMDIKTQTSAYNPLDQNASITATPFFGNSYSKDGKSDFSTIAEAWYVKVTNTSGAGGCNPNTVQFSYIDQNGAVQLLQLASPNSTTIITQNIGWNFFNETVACYGRDYDVEVISKYTGNVIPYPYKNVPIRYIVNPATSAGNFRYLYYQPTGSLGEYIPSGSFILFDTASAITSTNFPAIYNTAMGGTANQSILALIPTGVPGAQPIYKLTNCITAQAITASFTDWSLYATNRVLSLSSSNVGGCYTINEVTTSIIPTHTNVSVLNNYLNCTNCSNDYNTGFFYVNVNSGNLMPGGNTLTYTDVSGNSRTLNLNIVGNTFKFNARAGSITSSYSPTTITQLSADFDNKINYSVWAGGGFSTNRIFTYQSGSGEVVQINSNGNFGTSSYCAISSSLIQTWPNNGSFPYTILTGSSC